MTKYNGMKVLEIDIETAPHNVFAWGLFKQNIYLDQIVEPGYTLCYAAKWQHEKTMEFDSLFINEKEPLFARVWELLDEADAVVHYNGKNFDMPTLNGEFAQLGFPPPSNYKQIDLLQVVRSNFRIASNKMDFVARMFGIEGKVPHKGMDLWKECMEGVELKWGDKIPPHVWTAWRKMELYNKQDVNILSQLF